MSSAVLNPSFISGEASPALFGHVDLQRLHSSAATMRNLFCRYTGGAYSRGGTAFVGYSKQTGRSVPPRLLTFQFNVNQGLALEFGHQYLRVMLNGAFVTNPPLAITAATNSNPLTVTLPASTGATATPINTNVVGSYAPGDTVTLAGGTYTLPAVISVTNTKLLGVIPVWTTGFGYAPGDTIHLAGGVQTTTAILTILTTRIGGATIKAAGTSGTPGLVTLTGTTGTGSKFTVVGTIDSTGKLVSLSSISYPGSYTVNPTTPGNEPVTGGGLSGAALAVALEPSTISVTNAGVFTTNPAGGYFTQASTSGSGAGAVFGGALMGVNVAAIATIGAYSVTPSNPVQQLSTSGSGVGIEFTMTWNSTASLLGIGDWVYFSGVGGMTELNGRTAVVSNAAGNVYSFHDVFGTALDSTGWGIFTSGGTGAEIYTATSPYAEADLKWLKITQSADVISIGCVNQSTGTEYPLYNLTRFADNNWQFVEFSTDETITPPPYCGASASPQPQTSATDYIPTAAWYQYVVTAVNPKDGTESIASPIGWANNAVDISVTAGTVTVTWGAVPEAIQYDVYKATPVSQWGYFTTNPPPIGALFGFAGTALGTQFIDTNIVPDFAQTPPTHQNPFSRGQIIGCNAIVGGSGYSPGNFNGPNTVNVTITTSTGSGAQIVGIVVGDSVVAYVVQSSGKDYATTDTATVSGGGGGAGATCQLLFGPQSGTYPGGVAYFQERFVAASTLNNPDTYWMSQPGAFNNFDFRVPTIDTDSISGTPWTQQVNGIQFMVPMPGGLVVLTGLGAWQLGGQGSSALNPQPITPAGQQAQPQAYNGCSPTVPPIKVSDLNDILYVQAKGSIVRDLTYQFFTNIYTGKDLTVNSSHLFLNYMINEWAYCDEPYKLIWAVRNDGALLCLTYYKVEEVTGWSRHDTQLGTFESVCSVIEPPVDALYCCVQRATPVGFAYMIERMDNRLWKDVESSWCVDCGLTVPLPTRNARLQASSANGLGSISGYLAGLVGGNNYSPATTVTVVDDNGAGPGSGCVVTPIIANGVITGLTIVLPGAKYTRPAFVIFDPAGTGDGAFAFPTLNPEVTFTADANVFALSDVGSVLRMSGGTATITTFVSATEIQGNMTVPINQFVFGVPGDPAIAGPGEWTIAAPTSTFTGLYHLAGMQVTGLADGVIVPPTTVDAGGNVDLPIPATRVTLGLGFTAQLQSVYLEAGGTPTVQGQRKKIGNVTVRVDSSRDFEVGSNQVDGSTLSPMQIAPVWTEMVPMPNPSASPYANPTPLYTGDVRVPVKNNLGKPGQVAVQQRNPVPLAVMALVPEALEGDSPSQQFQQKKQQEGRGR